MELQQISAQHPKIKQVLAIQRNTAPNLENDHRRGVWTHNLLLEHNVFIDTFLWCPEAAYGDEARTRAVEQRSRIMGTVTSASSAASSLNLLQRSTSELPKTKRTALRSNSAIPEL